MLRPEEAMALEARAFAIEAPYPVSVAKTWSMTLEKLDPLARSLLRIAAWVAPNEVPRGVFRTDHSAFSKALGENVTISDLDVAKALGELARLSLIRLTPETISVHRLVQSLEQNSLTGYEDKLWAPEWPDVAIFLENYAVLFRNMSRPEEADSLESRALALRARSIGQP
jgi:hypothetical protein